ncbi:FAD:protein FMN transferase [Tropicimonas sp. S265A]|uniref:FAD:protein FMN transferase n=1 Tax=Tropicimonas sp. S265A TaxID=3415134 RepID=UPI003C798D05
MTLSRRRFIAITAAALSVPKGALARTHHWKGRALGAEAAISLTGGAEAERALQAALDRLRRVEATFNLFDPASELSRLNRAGHTPAASDDLITLCQITDRVHAVTGGMFDPTIQTAWEALRRALPPRYDLTGWQRVARNGPGIRLGAGQRLSFNGIAQGFATDAVTDVLAAHGFSQTLVNIGEYRAGSDATHAIGIADPLHGLVGQRRLKDGAIATSGPGAMSVRPGQSHILHPRGTALPLWSSVTVEGATAVWADALSTAFCLMPKPEIAKTKARLKEARRVVLVDAEGNLRSL